jgi:anti-sigma regulatory factor (Ser/Thr protein kinase)
VFEHALPTGSVAPGEARRHVRDRLAEGVPPQVVADVELLTSELVSNAVRHATMDEADTIGLTIAIGPQTIRVAVIDGGAGFDATKLDPVPGPDEGGWGLFLVEQMSDRWGIDKDPHGVWFEIDRDDGLLRATPGSESV